MLSLAALLAVLAFFCYWFWPVLAPVLGGAVVGLKGFIVCLANYLKDHFAEISVLIASLATVIPLATLDEEERATFLSVNTNVSG